MIAFIRKKGTVRYRDLAKHLLRDVKSADELRKLIMHLIDAGEITRTQDGKTNSYASR